ncbi:trophoblast glycoprotein-like [Anolis carolinensis]|uniref:trophoblast glycoprotein-like n=1 Tax=Anolis carolinensis TaxID=28377 RepID=UPI002F2B56C7
MARPPPRRAPDPGPAPPAPAPPCPLLPPPLLPPGAGGAGGAAVPGGAVLVAEVLLLFLRGVCPSPAAPRSAPCPSAPCFCFSTPDTDQCRYLALQDPPQGLPEPVRNLSILGGNLTLLPGAAFAGGWRGEDREWTEGEDAATCRPLPHLRVLLLTHNNIEVVEGGAFAGLPALTLLDLSHNPLQALSPFAFAFCPHLHTLRLNQALLSSPETLLKEGSLVNVSLTRLELRGNRLRDAPPGWALPPSLRDLDLRNNSLRGLRAQRLDSFLPLPALRLQLGANPLDCQCASLRPLLRWQSNATWRLLDARSLRCNSPARLKEALLRRLQPAQLGCPPGDDNEEEQGGWGLLDTGRDAQDPQLETASYVFFGIVLALIGLVFLMVLYLNRKGIKRWLNNLREACRDQMEGYHYRYEQDSDPRRVGSGDL